ncbi:hypothetical protein G6F56_010652 [Rhizopus delemar]|nr:hypothetical protein G6F56_010652 [Rhizopus delemar]
MNSSEVNNTGYNIVGSSSVHPETNNGSNVAAVEPALSELSNEEIDTMLLDSWPVIEPPTMSREEELLQNNLAQLRGELGTLLEDFGAARSAGNESATDESLHKIERTKMAIKSLEGCSDIFNKSSMHASIAGSDNDLGLTLNRRDLPKFQLASNLVRPYPNEEVFESVDHFLRTFENVIKSSSMNIENAWRKLLPLCLSHSDDSWVETSLKRCSDWNSVRECFKERHGSSLVTRRYTDQVFTMTMKNSESIADYSKRFLQSVYNASLSKDDARIADRFLASLTLPVQTLVRVTMARSGPTGESKRDWTVEQITQIGRDILGDDNRLYAEATQLIPGARSHNEKNYGTHQEKKRRDYDHKPKDRVRKPETPYFCSHHGRNRTHESKDCFTLKNKKVNGVAKDLNPCRRCDEPYGPGHICKKGKVPVLAVTKDATEKESVLEQVDSNIDSQMEDIHFDF